MTGRPTAAPPYFPYDHPSMAVVMRDEARIAWLVDRRMERNRHRRERRSARG